MLTVKHIIWGGGFETLYQAKQVRAKFPDRKSVGAPAPAEGPEFVAFDLPNGEVWKLDGGKVYVMNENGKTVASYDVGACVQGETNVASTTPGYSTAGRLA